MLVPPEHAWFSAKHAPVIHMRPPHDVTAEDHQTAREAIVKWMLDVVDRPYGYIVDLSERPDFNAYERKQWAIVEKKYAHIELLYSFGQAIIAPDAMTRGLMTAMYWISPAVYPTKLVKTVDAAFDYLQTQVENLGPQYPHGVAWTERKGWAEAAKAQEQDAASGAP